MTYFYLLLSLLAVDLLAAISPGPNFVVVTQAAVNGTRRHAAAVVAGIVAANLIWCAAVAFGLSALFSSAAVQRFYARARRPVNRVAGAAMVGFGGRLMLVRE